MHSSDTEVEEKRGCVGEVCGQGRQATEESLSEMLPATDVYEGLLESGSHRLKGHF
jgi:hypothetical protein